MSKDRILFWIDVEFMYFGIAQKMKEKYDFDAYAVIDFNEKAKKFFKHQDLVKFEKTWFYLDIVNIKKKEYDLDYLKSFEKKFEISIWQIAYSERAFYNFNKYYKFTYQEILSIIEQECRFYEKILDEINPDFLIMKMSDLHQNHLMYEMCKAKGIKIIMLFPSRLGYTVRLGETVTKFDHTYEIDSQQNISFEYLRKYIREYSAFKQIKDYRRNYLTLNTKKIISALRFFLDIFNNNYQKRFTNYKRTRSKIITKQIVLLFKKRYRRYFLQKNSKKHIGKELFVYFPLHVEPERTLYVDSPFYNNQIEIISNLAKALPIEYTLYVKEHPTMEFNGWRSISEYKKIINLQNVKLIHTSTDPEEIYKNCSLVVTLTGSSGLEALFYGKPVITFTELIYSRLSSVCTVKNIEDLPELIKKTLNTKVNPNELYRFVRQLERDSFEFDWNHLRTKLSSEFYYGGFLTDFNIPVITMKKFLKKFNSDFEKLAVEHIKKIKEHKLQNKQNQDI